MEILKYYARGFWVDKHMTQWFTTILIMVNVGLGVAVLAGGRARFTLPSYQPLIDYSQGNTWVWGLWIGLAALLMSVPFRWPNILGLWLSMFWHLIWMACFTIAAIHYDNAAATPIPVYGGLAMVSAALLTARVIDKSGG